MAEEHPSVKVSAIIGEPDPDTGTTPVRFEAEVAVWTDEDPFERAFEAVGDIRREINHIAAHPRTARTGGGGMTPGHGA